MDLMTVVFSYFLIWWLVLFTVLPLGVERNADERKGHDAGAPVKPDLKKKMFLTSIISAVILAAIWVLVAAEVITWGQWFRGAIQ